MKEREQTTRMMDDCRNPLFLRLPPEYYGYALQWCAYPRWTIEETANLLTGCVPHREMFLRGKRHKDLDVLVLANENRIRAALGKELLVVPSKKYFEQTYIDSHNIVDWAIREGIDVPAPLVEATGVLNHQRASHGYRTPCMAAVDWVVEQFWKRADLRDPPGPGEIKTALLQQFEELNPAECEMVEYIARHPAARAAATIAP